MRAMATGLELTLISLGGKQRDVKPDKWRPMRSTTPHLFSPLAPLTRVGTFRVQTSFSDGPTRVLHHWPCISVNLSRDIIISERIYEWYFDQFVSYWGDLEANIGFMDEMFKTP